MSDTPDTGPSRAAYDAYLKKRDALTADLDILVGIHARSMPAAEVTLTLMLYAAQSALMNGKTEAMLLDAVKVVAKHHAKHRPET